MKSTVLIGASLVLFVTRVQGAGLEGFRLEDTHWTYVKGDLSFDGILIRPAGQGPFPAILISHGLGGSAESFGLQKAREMAGWGYVCIAPNYTHSRGAMPASSARPGRPPQAGGSGPDRANNYGASDENLRRAAACLDILASLPYVDRDRIAAYGHSMGGFVTIGLAAREPKRLFAAANSGSGVAPRAGFAAPSIEDAAKIRTPLIMFHGADDTTVRPEQSASLQAALEKNGVPNERHVYDGVNHPVDQVKAQEAYSLTKAWFTKHAPR